MLHLLVLFLLFFRLIAQKSFLLLSKLGELSVHHFQLQQQTLGHYLTQVGKFGTGPHVAKDDLLAPEEPRVLSFFRHLRFPMMTKMRRMRKRIARLTLPAPCDAFSCASFWTFRTKCPSERKQQEEELQEEDHWRT